MFAIHFFLLCHFSGDINFFRRINVNSYIIFIFFNIEVLYTVNKSHLRYCINRKRMIFKNDHVPVFANLKRTNSIFNT